jgi:acyl transferase domain-containing protein
VTDEHKIAIVGMACSVPGAANYRDFAALLRAGRSGLRTLTRAELLEGGADPATLDDPGYVPVRGIIDRPDHFDASFFGLTRAEAESMDPQHRAFFMAAWRALEDAGHAQPERRRGAGVFGACSPSSYARAATGMRTSAELLSLIGSAGDHLSTRLSFKLDLHGPSMTVQTSCSSSLMAVTLAVQSLLTYQCDLALAGGASVHVPFEGYIYERGAILSPDGHCRAFDARADGTVASDGVGAVVLKRLEDALADGDAIHAVISGFGVNNDGKLKVGYAAPSVDGQIGAVRSALRFAGTKPEEIGLIEAHGTGTALGDPIEVAALREVFDAVPGPIALGSVKSNLGHVNEAAGVVSLIKTALSVSTGTIFPTIDVQQPNPALGLDDSAFFLPMSAQAWPADRPRIAGVSSFGVGGTNVHVIVEEPPRTRSSSAADAEAWPLLFSTKSPEVLPALVASVLSHIVEEQEELPSVSRALAEGREHFPHRRLVLASSVAGAASAEPVALTPAGRPKAPVTVLVGESGHGADGMTTYDGSRLARVAAFRDALAEAERTRPALPRGVALQYALIRTWQAHVKVRVQSDGTRLGDRLAAVVNDEAALASLVVGEPRPEPPALSNAQPSAGPQASRPGEWGASLLGRHLGTDLLARLMADFATAWALGHDVLWRGLYDGVATVHLPGSPLALSRYWHDDVRPPAMVPAALADEPVTGATPGTDAASGSRTVSDEGVLTAILAMMTAVLGDRPDDVEADFYAMGGDSLAALDLVSRIEDEFGVRLEVDDVFENPTAGGLVALVSSMTAEEI